MPCDDPLPITDAEVYRAALAACVAAEASDHRRLARVLRSWVDASPFSSCPACDGRTPLRAALSCSRCQGDGFVSDESCALEPS